MWLARTVISPDSLGKLFHPQQGDLLAIQLGDEQSSGDHQPDGVTGLLLTNLIRIYFYSFHLSNYVIM